MKKGNVQLTKINVQEGCPLIFLITANKLKHGAPPGLHVRTIEF